MFLIKLRSVVSTAGAFQSQLPDKKKKKNQPRVFFTIWNNVSFNIWDLLKTASPSSAICLNFLQLCVVIPSKRCTVGQTKKMEWICTLASVRFVQPLTRWALQTSNPASDEYASYFIHHLFSCVSKHWSVLDVTIIMVWHINGVMFCDFFFFNIL